MSAQTSSLGLKSQARALAGLIADQRASKWLVGTNALREENEVSLVLSDIPSISWLYGRPVHTLLSTRQKHQMVAALGEYLFFAAV